MKELLEYITWLLKYYLPPMIANASPVLVHGARRIDCGLVFIDKKPLFGAHKTWEGLAIGVVNAFITGSSLGILFRDISLPLLAIGAGFFALLGDLVGAFIKRRLGLKPGAPLPIIDQWDFIAGTILFYYLVGETRAYSNPVYLSLTLLIILVLHIGTNLIAYKLGLKHSKL